MLQTIDLHDFPSLTEGERRKLQDIFNRIVSEVNQIQRLEVQTDASGVTRILARVEPGVKSVTIA